MNIISVNSDIDKQVDVFNSQVSYYLVYSQTTVFSLLHLFLLQSCHLQKEKNSLDMKIEYLAIVHG